ncbi:dockerin type I domain-containing protein [Synechococcus sp. PCC 7336]|uniref:dockerin type I domain-containing protein n=1 Tax=Synechococcus sp. PCC 7336 TaxID=195250 RepID=UPI00034C73A6|nr:dockerin type I domain-containing protein [Synechococcus sp. PCC 7336]
MDRLLLVRVGFLPLAAIALSIPAIARAQGFLSGDIDGNGQVTAADLSLLSDYLAGENSFADEQIVAADVNRDGNIDRSDYTQLEQSIRVESARINSEVQLDSAFSGQVIDRSTGQPLADVAVDIPGAGVAVRTDSQGRFRLPDNVPSNEILTAQLEDYAPFSQTTSGEGGTLRVELEKLDTDTTLVLESSVVHLGDDAYSQQSAAAGQFQLRTQGREMARTFRLDRIPNQSPTLKIGSLIGLDTAAAYRAGQSRIPSADMTPLEVELNGNLIRRIDLGADNIAIPLPLSGLREGLNTVVLRTGRTTHLVSRGGNAIAWPIFGGNFRINTSSRRRTAMPTVDYDDIELANVTIEVPTN